MGFLKAEIKPFDERISSDNEVATLLPAFVDSFLEVDFCAVLLITLGAFPKI